MQTWIFPAVIERRGPADFVVTFSDVSEAITGAATVAQARALAEDALEEAILGRLAHGDLIPQPRAARKGEEAILLDPVTAARAALAQTMRETGTTNVALAAKLGKTEGAVRRLVDGSTGVKIGSVLAALAVLGRSATLSVRIGAQDAAA